MDNNIANSSERLARLASAPVGRLLWDYSLPAVVGMLVMSLYNVIDRIFIGQGVGPEAIAGLAITFPLMNLATAVGVLVGVGSSARISIVLGAGDREQANLILGNALTLTFVNAAVYIALFAIFLEPVLRAFGASDATLPYARDFILYLLPGLLMTNLAYGLNNIMRASGYPSRAMFTMLIGALTNLLLAPLFIFVFGMGIKGAAIATDIAMGVSAVFVMAHFFRRDSLVRFTPRTYALKWPVVLSIISIGAAPALVNAAACFINVIINTTLYRYGGDNAVGAAGIFTTYASLLTTIVLGICQGMQPIVGYNYGAGSVGRLRRVYLIAVGVSTLITAIGSLVGTCFPESVAAMFTTDTLLQQNTVRALSLSMMAFSVVGFQIITTAFFQSIGKASQSIFLSLTRQVLFLIPLLLVMPDRFGLDGVWLAFPSSDIIATAVALLRVVLQFKIIERSFKKKSC